MKTAALMVHLILLLAAPALAQEASPSPEPPPIVLPPAPPLPPPPSGPTLEVGLEDAMRRAVAEGAAAQVARAEAERARALASEARGALLPRVDAQLSRIDESINLATFGFSLPGQPPVVGPFDVYEGQVRAAVQLFDLAAWRRYRAVREAAQGRALAAAQAEEDVALAAARLYLLLQRADADVRARAADVQVAEDVARIAQDQYRVGAAARLDVARAGVRLSRSREAHLVALNTRDDARLGLLHALGEDQRRQVQLPAAAPVAPPQAPAPDVEAAVREALAERPDVHEAESAVAQARLQVGAARAARLPTLGGEFTGDYAGNDLHDLHWSRSIAAVLRAPVFLGGRLGAAQAQARATLGVAEARLGEARRSVEEETRRAVGGLAVARIRVSVAEQGLALAEDELASARRRLAAGVGSGLEVDQAQEGRRQAQADLINATSDQALAEVALRHATGALHPAGTAP